MSNIKDIGLNVMWIEKCIYMGNDKVEAHSHTFFHYLYVIDGTGSITIGRKKMILQKDTIYMVTPNTVHSFQAGEDETLILLEIKFTVTDADLMDKLDKIPLKLEFYNNKILKLLDSMLNESIDRIVYYTEIINAIFYEITIFLLRAAFQKSNAITKIDENENLYGIKSEFRKVISYIRKNLGNHITLEDLSDIMCLEKTHFIKKFKKEFGVTPIKYLNDVRIDKAKELLEYSDMNVTQISNVTGFSSIHYFSRIFSKTVGMNPIKYQKKF